MASMVTEWQYKIQEFLATLPIDWSAIGQWVPAVGSLKRPHFEPFEFIIIGMIFIIAFIHGCIIRRRKIKLLTLKHRPNEFIKAYGPQLPPPEVNITATNAKDQKAAAMAALTKKKPAAGGERPTVVAAFIGDSLTSGIFSYDYVGALAKDQTLTKGGFHFLNAANHTDTIERALIKLDTVLATCPDRLYVMVGTLNVISELSPRAAKFYRSGTRRAPLPPVFSVAAYTDALQQLIAKVNKHNVEQDHRDQRQVTLRICTLPPISDYISSRANQVVQQYNHAIISTCQSATPRIPVIDVFGQLVSLLELSGGATKPAAGKGRVAPTYSPDSYMRVARRQHWSHFVRGQSWDDISAAFGSKLFTDNVHLNSHAGHTVLNALRGDLTGTGAAVVSSSSDASSSSSNGGASTVPQSPYASRAPGAGGDAASPVPSTPVPPMPRLLSSPLFAAELKKSANEAANTTEADRKKAKEKRFADQKKRLSLKKKGNATIMRESMKEKFANAKATAAADDDDQNGDMNDDL